MTAAPCSGCGALIAVPSAGIERFPFVLLKVLQYVGTFMIGAMLKEASFLVIPVTMGVSVWLAVLRLDNIGSNRWLATVAALPVVSLIFSIYLASAKPGSGRK